MSKKAKIIIVTLCVLLLTATALYLFIFRWDRITYYDGTYDSFESSYEGFGDPWCNVAGINLHGDLYTYITLDDEQYDFASSEYIVSQLWEANELENIEVIILEIDSTGGLPVAAEEIYKQIQSMEKPVIALIRESGLSAAYYAASAADVIFASALSDVGSIGVTMSYTDESKFNKESGTTVNIISSGKFKDSGWEEKELTAEERALFQRDVDITHEHFVKAVADGRDMEIDEVRKLADGSSMLGEMALKAGLIDHIGNYDDVEDYIQKTYNLDEVQSCW